MRIKTKFVGSAVLIILATTVLSCGRALLFIHAEKAVEDEIQVTRQVENAILGTHLALQTEVELVNQFLLTGKRMDRMLIYRSTQQEFNRNLTILETIMPVRDPLAGIRLASLRRRHQQLANLSLDIFERNSLSEMQTQQFLRTLQTYQAENNIYLAELFESVENWDHSLDQTIRQRRQRTLVLECISLGLILLLLVLQHRSLFVPMFKAIETLKWGAKQLGQGELKHRLSVVTHNHDEFTQLAYSFNTMAQQMEDSYANLEDTVARRTNALRRTNMSLEQEICDRITTEKRLIATLEQLKLTQAQLIHTEKMSSLGQLVAGIAHEINNPISFIAGNLEPALDYANSLLHLLHRYQQEHVNPSDDLAAEIADADLDFITTDYPKLITSMETGVIRITRIIESLRTFARLDEATHKLIDLHHSLDSILLLLEGKLQGPRHHIHVIKHYGKIPKIECYCSQLNQAFMNILTNAIEALNLVQISNLNPTPTVTIHTESISMATAPNLGHPSNYQSVTAHPKATSSYVLVTIADNGPGIPTEIQPRIFDPFFSRKTASMGVGLGLSTSHQIVTTLHQGHLKYRDIPTGGAAFDIYLPVNGQLKTSTSMQED